MLEPKAAGQERHEQFLLRVVQAGMVWGLKGPNGFTSSGSNEVEDTQIIPFWSDRAYAKRCAQEDWAHMVPTPIPLTEFLSAWLPGMHGDGVLAGTNWNAQLIGREIEPLQLLVELQDRLGSK